MSGLHTAEEASARGLFRRGGMRALRAFGSPRGSGVAGASLLSPLPRVQGLPLVATPLTARAKSGALDATWTSATVHPWRRCFARMLDYYTLGLVVYGIFCVLAYAISTDVTTTARFVENTLFASLTMTLLMVPVLAMFVGLTGFSPGKWLAGIRVARPDGQPLGYRTALRREMVVALNGMCLGLSLMSLATMAYAHQTLKARGSTSWDRECDAIVFYTPTTGGVVIRLTLAILGSLTTLFWFHGLHHGRG